MTSRALLTIAKRLPRGYWPIIRFVAQHDPALWDIPLPLRFVPGSAVRADLREPLYTQFLLHGCFPNQVGVDRLCTALLRPGDRVFDVGANIGYPTVLFAEIVGERGEVIALEPSHRAQRHLQRTIGDRANVRCLALAASDSRGQATFYETSSLTTSSLVATEAVAEYTVDAVLLDDLAQEFGPPNFVKIDVEGHEPAVLRGMRNLLSGGHPPIVMFEALTETALSVSTNIIGQLSGGQFEVFRVDPSGRLMAAHETDAANDYVAMPGWAAERKSNLT